MSNYKILHLEDNPSDSELVRIELEAVLNDFEYINVSNKIDFTKALTQDTYRLILSDYHLPDCNGKESLELALQHCPDIPFILISGALGEELAIEILSKGATDYVMKQNLDKLPLSIERALKELSEHEAKIQAENELATSEEKYRTLFENANDGIFLINKENRTILDVNANAARLLGYDRAELIGKPITHLYPKSQAHFIKKQVDFLIEEGKIVFETFQQKKDGSLIEVEISSAIHEIRNEDVIQSFVRDISQRKVIEHALVESEKRYRSLFDQMQEGILLSDVEGKILLVNPQFCELTGYSEKELIGQNGYRLLHSDSVGKRAKEKLKQREKGETEKYDLPMIRKDGEKRWVRISASPKTDEFGNLTGVMSLIQDITVSRIHEKELKIKHEEALRYQSMLISTQINPHFIFNALNSIQYFILAEKAEPALDFISGFSKLIRMVLENSLHKTISIYDEINFLELYLDLEKKRYNEKFNFEITCDDSVDIEDLQLPPMLLQPYVENTVIHGIGNLEKGGMISIDFTGDEDIVLCTIRDNGVGRERAQELKKLRTGNETHKSRGMGLTATRLDLLNQLADGRYEVQIDDLEDGDGNPLGTQITVKFPMVFDH